MVRSLLDVRVLGKHAHARALLSEIVPASGSICAADKLEQRGFAAAVHAHQPHAAARLKR